MSVVIYNGGLDSYTLLKHALLLEDKNDIHVITFTYGQDNSKAVTKTVDVCNALAVSQSIIGLKCFNHAISDQSLTSAVPTVEGPHSSQSIKESIIPNRNMIMIAMAASLALKENRSLIYYAGHSEDSLLYNEQQPDFVKAMNLSLSIMSDDSISINAPFVEFTKAEVLEYGTLMGLDYKDTWTCFFNKNDPCNKCIACMDRESAFTTADLPDPLLEGFNEDR